MLFESRPAIFEAVFEPIAAAVEHDGAAFEAAQPRRLPANSDPAGTLRRAWISDTWEVITTPEEYLQAAPPPGQPWLREFWGYVHIAYPDQRLTMFRQTPMFKFGRSYQQGYVMFTAAKTHFAVHAVDFDLVELARSAIPGSKGGKGNVSVKYGAESAKPALKSFVDAVIKRHLGERASLHAD